MSGTNSPRLDRFCVKLYARDPAALDLEAAIPVFHRWIQEKRVEGLLIDVADYRHVPDGPGVLLVGHEADYVLDLAEGPPGLLYNRKRLGAGPFETRFHSAIHAALSACRALEQEPEMARKGLAFDGSRLRFIANDRLAAPNEDATLGLLRPGLEAVLATLYPGLATLVARDEADRRERFTVHVEAASDRPLGVAALLERFR